MGELSLRARQVLYHAVTEYVATGAPVGSRLLAKKSGLKLSPASIRNVLADLEEGGYLAQPHTSAGRIPTDRAFRLFIDALMEVRELSVEERGRLRERFAQIDSSSNVMRETGKILSELTGTAAVVMAPRTESIQLKHLRFIRTSPDDLLAVLVLADGTVHNRFLKAGVTERDLQSVHNLLDDVIEGRNLGELRDLFARRLAAESVQHDEIRRQAFELGGQAVGHAINDQSSLVIEGQDLLLEKPEFAGGEGVRQVVSALDAREQLVRLLDATMEARAGSVVLGHEAGELGGGNLSIVGAPYLRRGQAIGSIGIIGPTRMDYPTVVPLVAAAATAVTELLERAQARRDEGDD